MKRISRYILMFFVLAHYSCAQTSSYGVAIEDPQDILKNQSSFLRYSNTYLKLSEDFVAFDLSLKLIGKREFLRQLSTGGYLPLRLTSNDTACYKLYKIPTSTDDYISLLIQNMGMLEYKHFQMEGKALPKFNFIDLEGQLYNPETTKGKIVIIKFWFIKCQKCVEEMPALNKLVNQYKNRNDIVFLSLAFDQTKDLKNFLSKTTFNYAVAANQADYLIKDLEISYYPTHVVINKNNVVVKVLDSYQEMELVLKKESTNE